MTQIIAVNHVFDDPDMPFVDQGITIDDDVWIGSGEIITDGVHIEKGAVVVAGAVVVKDVAAHTVVGGIPAKVLRNINGEEVREYSPIYFPLTENQSFRSL